MPVNSRRKGATFERAIARDLRAWLGDDYEVTRIRTDQQQGTEHAGEFAVEGPQRFPFALELKAHKAFSVVQLWKGSGPFAGWWDQAVMQAEGCSRLPMLVFRVPYGPVLCAMRVVHARRMWLTGHEPTMFLHLDDGTPEGENLWIGLWEQVTSKAIWSEVVCP